MMTWLTRRPSPTTHHRHLFITDGKGYSLRLQRFSKHIGKPLPQFPQAEGTGFQLDLARLDPGHIQNVVDQR